MFSSFTQVSMLFPVNVMSVIKYIYPRMYFHLKFQTLLLYRIIFQALNWIFIFKRLFTIQQTLPTTLNTLCNGIVCHSSILYHIPDNSESATGYKSSTYISTQSNGRYKSIITITIGMSEMLIYMDLIAAQISIFTIQIMIFGWKKEKKSLT